MRGWLLRTHKNAAFAWTATALMMATAVLGLAPFLGGKMGGLNAPIPFLPAETYTGPTILHHGKNVGSACNTLTVGLTVTVGDAIVVLVGAYTGSYSDPVASVADSLNNPTFAEIGVDTSGTGAWTVDAWWSQDATAGGPDTITITASSCFWIAAVAFDVDGGPGGVQIDSGVSSNFGSGSVELTAYSPNEDNVLALFTNFIGSATATFTAQGAPVLGGVHTLASETDNGTHGTVTVTGVLMTDNPSATVNEQVWVNASSNYAWVSIASGFFNGSAPPPPSAPSNLVATPISTSTIHLTWTNPTGALTDNHVYAYVGTHCGISLGSHDIGSPATSYSWSGLRAATPYSFSVTATNATLGVGPASTCANATTFGTYGYYSKVLHLTGFNPLGTYLSGVAMNGVQLPVLSSSFGQPAGIYYVGNTTIFCAGSTLPFYEYELQTNTVRQIACIVPLYLYGYTEMLDNEFYVEYGYNQALFFGKTTAIGGDYSIELVNLNTGAFQMWNTTAGVDGTNQQPDYIGNSVVVVFTENDTAYAWNLSAHTSWLASNNIGGVGWSQSVEANNIYWLPQRNQFINVEAHGDTGDQVIQLNATYPSGQIHLTQAAVLTVDTGVTVGVVDGLAYNASYDGHGGIAYSAGAYSYNKVYTYTLAYTAAGLLTTAGEARYLAYSPSQNGTVLWQRYVYTSAFTASSRTNATGYQQLFDPWNGYILQTNISFVWISPCANGCFEGSYGPSPAYLISFSASEALNTPDLYRIVYDYHNASSPYPPYNLPPSAPSFSSITQTTATASWTQGAFGDGSSVVNNTVLLGVTCGTWTMRVSTTGAATSKALSGFTAATTYCSAIEMWNGTGGFVTGPTANFTTAQGAPPALTITLITPTSFNETWTNTTWTNVTVAYLGFTSTQAQCGATPAVWTWAVGHAHRGNPFIPNGLTSVTYDYNVSLGLNTTFFNGETVWVALLVNTTTHHSLMAFSCQSVTFSAAPPPPPFSTSNCDPVCVALLIAFGGTTTITACYFLLLGGKRGREGPPRARIPRGQQGHSRGS